MTRISLDVMFSSVTSYSQLAAGLPYSGVCLHRPFPLGLPRLAKLGLLVHTAVIEVVV